VTSLAELQAGDPQRIGPYVLVGRLGSGGMGRVYLARSPGGRQVAVKVIRAELADDEGFRARFAREVTAARKVGGLFTAQVVDADLESPVPWLVTAFVPGLSLAEAVDRGEPLPPVTVLALAAGLAEGLNAIHAAGVIHRDLKPSNVLLALDGPRIIDFGIASAAEATALTGTDHRIGSPGFMSPEQAEGRTIGPASDIFSLAGVLTFAIRGEGPFGTGDTSALLYRVVHGTPNLDRIPGRLTPLISWCLSKDATRRPSAAEFLAELVATYPGAADLTDWLPARLRDAADQRASSAYPGRQPLAVAPGAEAAEVPARPALATAAPADRVLPAASVVEPLRPTRTSVQPRPGGGGALAGPDEYGAQAGPGGYAGRARPGLRAGQGGPGFRVRQGGAPGQGGSGGSGTSWGSGASGGSGVQDVPPWWEQEPTAVRQAAPPWYPPDSRPGGRRRRGLWVGFIAVVCAAVIAGLVLALGMHAGPAVGQGAGSARSLAPPAPTATPTVGYLTLAQLRAGDCLTGADLRLDTAKPWPRLAQAVPCGQRHTAEVFLADDSFWAENLPYPGSATVVRAADAACNSAFRSYVGIAYDKSRYTWTNVFPDAATWLVGDRGLHCVAYYSTQKQRAGAYLTGSIRGSRR
jgi:tRNA A-37 threonylcarbamoyl transferase component Bud32